MQIFHGSQQIVDYPEIWVLRSHKDFYYGVYCTKLFNQAKRRAIRHSGHGYVSVYHYEPSSELRTLVFESMTDDWLDLIAACRSGQAHDYDIIEGPMADDTIFNYVQSFMNGQISRNAFWELA